LDPNFEIGRGGKDTGSTRAGHDGQLFFFFFFFFFFPNVYFFVGVIVVCSSIVSDAEAQGDSRLL
jgi:hypothetical protein